MGDYVGTHDFTNATVYAAAVIDDTGYQGSERTTSSTSFVDVSDTTITISGSGRAIIGITVDFQMKTNNASYSSSAQILISGTTLGDYTVVNATNFTPYLVNNDTSTTAVTTSTTFVDFKVYIPIALETVDSSTTIKIRHKTDNASGTNTIQATRVKAIYS